MSSGRYHSRLFNLVHQQSRRLTEHWERTFRHLQVATQWGVEALLYPVFLLLQSADATVKTLYAQEAPPQPKLQPNHTNFSPDTPPAADAPIQHVLEAVQNLTSEEVTVTPANTSVWFNPWEFLKSKFFHHPTTNSHLSQSLTISNKTVDSPNPVNQNDVLQRSLPVVRGIATDLVHRRLVLVSVENAILDILTPQQQAKLADRITSEVANYWHFQQLPEASKQGRLLPEIERILAKLTGKNTGENPVLAAGLSKFNIGKIIAFIDTSVASLETKAIVPVQKNSREMMRVVQTHVNIFLYGKEQLSGTGEIAVNHDDLTTPKLNISALIEAALNYFFGVGKDKQLVNQLDQYLPQSHQLNRDITDTWLDWHDLYGDAEKVTEVALVPSPSVGLSWHKQLNVPPSKAESNLVPRKKQPRHLTRIQPKSGRITADKHSESSISHRKNSHAKAELSRQQLHQETGVEAQPDWIETKATSVGYEKHLLEQILEYLDRGMLWLEEKLVKIFQQIQSLWRGK